MVILSPLRCLSVARALQLYSVIFVLWRRSGGATAEGEVFHGNTLDSWWDFMLNEGYFFTILV